MRKLVATASIMLWLLLTPSDATLDSPETSNSHGGAGVVVETSPFTSEGVVATAPSLSSEISAPKPSTSNAGGEGVQASLPVSTVAALSPIVDPPKVSAQVYTTLAQSGNQVSVIVNLQPPPAARSFPLDISRLKSQVSSAQESVLEDLSADDFIMTRRYQTLSSTPTTFITLGSPAKEL